MVLLPDRKLCKELVDRVAKTKGKCSSLAVNMLEVVSLGKIRTRVLESRIILSIESHYVHTAVFARNPAL